jgi:hypothetical protein
MLSRDEGFVPEGGLYNFLQSQTSYNKETTLLAMFQAQPSSTGRHHLKLVTALPCRRQVQMEILLRIESVYFGQ